jgi:hypothetical protein
LGYFKGKTRVAVLMTMLSLARDLQIDNFSMVVASFLKRWNCNGFEVGMERKNSTCFRRDPGWVRHVHHFSLKKSANVLIPKVHPNLLRSIRKIHCVRIWVSSKWEEMLGNFKHSVRGAIRKAPNIMP